MSAPVARKGQCVHSAASASPRSGDFRKPWLQGLWLTKPHLRAAANPSATTRTMLHSRQLDSVEGRAIVIIIVCHLPADLLVVSLMVGDEIHRLLVAGAVFQRAPVFEVIALGLEVVGARFLLDARGFQFGGGVLGAAPVRQILPLVDVR